MSKDYYLQPVKNPQFFFTLKTLVVRSGLEAMNFDGKGTKAFNMLGDKIEDDNILVTYLTPANTNMVLITSGYIAYCYKMPTYETRWNIDIKLNNDQIARIMKVFKSKNLSFDPERSCNTFDRNWVSTVAVTNNADIMAIGFVDGYINLMETSTRNLFHILQAHVDMVSSMVFTKGDVLLTGGIDSNIKVWRNVRNSNLSPEYIFLKHTDKVHFMRTFTVGEKEYILSADEEGIVYYWESGSYRADKFVAVEENSLIDGNDQMVFALSIENSAVILKKFSFAKKAPVSKIIVRYYSDMDDMKIKSLLGFNDSDIFFPKRIPLFSSQILLQSRQKYGYHLAQFKCCRVF